MDNESLEKVFREHKNLMEQLLQQRLVWLQRILVASTALFGILVTLQIPSEGLLYTRLAFATSIVLLALGILCTAIALSDNLNILTRTRKAHAREAQSAHREHREVDAVFVGRKTFYIVCERIAYICLALSILSLTAYSVLALFP